MNYFAAIWCLLAVAASSTADGGLGYGGLLYAPKHASADYYAYPRYAFEYAVNDPHTGDNKAQWEKRDGDLVRGAYSLVEPDGNLRIVEYWADSKSGFNAVVKRVGPSLHPTIVSTAPVYKAPIPVLNSGPIVAPISVGPIAKYSGLASAPLITGPLGYGGGAISTASLYKAAPIVVAPIAPAPILKSAPIPYELPAPVLPAALIKSTPYIGGSYYNALPEPILSAPAPLFKGPVGISSLSLGEGLLKSYPGAYDGLGLAKGGYDYSLGAAKAGPILNSLGGGYGGYH